MAKRANIHRGVIGLVTAIGALGIFTPSTQAAITWVSQNRYGGYGTYGEPTAYGRSLGLVPGYSDPIKQYPATGFGSFFAPVGFVGMTSNIDTVANTITAQGAGAIDLTNPTQSLNQVTYYRYWAVHFEATFHLTDPTPYSFTTVDYYSPNPNLKLLGPDGQTISFSTAPKTYEGILPAGDWTVLATGAPGGIDAGAPFSFTLALPEPSTAAAAVASTTALLLAGRRRARHP